MGTETIHFTTKTQRTRSLDLKISNFEFFAIWRLYPNRYLVTFMRDGAFWPFWTHC
jgi:hypothetical protein